MEGGEGDRREGKVKGRGGGEGDLAHPKIMAWHPI